MIQHYSPAAFRPVSIALETDREPEVVLNVTAKSKYVPQSDIERQPLSDCVPAYCVQLLAAKVLDSVIRSNVIFSLHIPCCAQCGLRFSAELQINAQSGRGWEGRGGEIGGVASWAKTPEPLASVS